MVFPDRAEPTTNTGALSLVVTLAVARLRNGSRHQRSRRRGSPVRFLPPGPVPHTVCVFREQKAEINLRSVQRRELLGAPSLCVFSQTRLLRQASQHLEKKAIQVVIGRRTQIRLTT